MPFNKEFVKDGEVYLVHKTIEKLNKLFEEVIVVTNNPTHYEKSNCIVLQDEIRGKGPLAGLSVALKKSKSDYMYLTAVDMPNISKLFIEFLLSLEEGYDVYSTENNSFVEPFHSVYHKNCLQAISESKSLFSLIKSVKSKIIDLNKLDIGINATKLFFNINNVSDLNTFNRSVEVQITKLLNDEVIEVNDLVVQEYPITLYVNNQKLVTILCTPENIDDLVIGYLNSEGIIDVITDVTSINIQSNRVDIKLSKEVKIKSKEKILYTACGVGTEYHDKLDQIVINTMNIDIQCSPNKIYELTKYLAQESELFKTTGGVHSALYQFDDKLILMEDIGRNNAVDKIIGNIMRNKGSFDGMLVVSGRLSSDMVLKCILANILIVISRSAPTSLAIKLAEKHGITLIGFARNKKMNIYSNRFRIKGLK